MSSPWARAAAAMARSLVALDGVYLRPGEVEFGIRLVPAAEAEQVISGSGFRAGRKARSVSFTVTCEQLGGEPRKGDLVGLGTERGWRVASFDLDAEGVSYVLQLERQD